MITASSWKSQGAKTIDMPAQTLHNHMPWNNKLPTKHIEAVVALEGYINIYSLFITHLFITHPLILYYLHFQQLFFEFDDDEVMLNVLRCQLTY